MCFNLLSEHQRSTLFELGLFVWIQHAVKCPNLPVTYCGLFEVWSGVVQSCVTCQAVWCTRKRTRPFKTKFFIQSLPFDVCHLLDKKCCESYGLKYDTRSGEEGWFLIKVVFHQGLHQISKFTQCTAIEMAYDWLLFILQLQSPIGISPMGNIGCFLWGKPAATVTLPNLHCTLGVLVFL